MTDVHCWMKVIVWGRIYQMLNAPVLAELGRWVSDAALGRILAKIKSVLAWNPIGYDFTTRRHGDTEKRNELDLPYHGLPADVLLE
jgi:hypothetical protein